METKHNLEEYMAEFQKDKFSIKALLHGTASKRHMGIYFFSFLIFLITMWLLAQSLYIGGYSIFKDYISGQGDPNNNPNGYLFFMFGTGLTGISLIPFYIYLFRRFIPTLKFISQVFVLSGIISSIGLTMVGFFPRNTAVDLLHDIGADMAFNGAGLCAVCTMFILIRKMVLKTEWPKLYQFLILYGLVFGVGAWIPFQSNSYLTQWTGFFILMIWMIGLFIIVPDN